MVNFPIASQGFRESRSCDQSCRNRYWSIIEQRDTGLEVRACCLGSQLTSYWLSVKSDMTWTVFRAEFQCDRGDNRTNSFIECTKKFHVFHSVYTMKPWTGWCREANSLSDLLPHDSMLRRIQTLLCNTADLSQSFSYFYNCLYLNWLQFLIKLFPNRKEH